MGSTSIIEESEFRLVPQGPGHPQSTVQNHQDKPAVLVVTHIYYFNDKIFYVEAALVVMVLGPFERLLPSRYFLKKNKW